MTTGGASRPNHTAPRRTSARLAGLIAPAVLAWWLSAGCSPDQLGAPLLVDLTGQQIRLDLIDDIVNDPDLTEAARRQTLRDLGIDDDLVELLLETSTVTPAPPEADG